MNVRRPDDLASLERGRACSNRLRVHLTQQGMSFDQFVMPAWYTALLWRGRPIRAALGLEARSPYQLPDGPVRIRACQFQVPSEDTPLPLPRYQDPAELTPVH
jgi:hypothetical protein